MNGWNTNAILGWVFFRCDLLVSGSVFIFHWTMIYKNHSCWPFDFWSLPGTFNVESWQHPHHLHGSLLGQFGIEEFAMHQWPDRSVFEKLRSSDMSKRVEDNIAKFWLRCGGFLKWWYPTTMGFPRKNDHFGVFWGYHHLRKHPCIVFHFLSKHCCWESNWKLEDGLFPDRQRKKGRCMRDILIYTCM